MNRLSLVAAVAGALAAVPAASVAQTTPDCSALTAPTYVAGSSAIEPLIKKLSPIVASQTTLVYQNQGSCTGVNAIVNSTPITGTANYYAADGTKLTCNLPAGGQSIDVGVSDVFVETCGNGKPADVGDFAGPYQAMLFVVPKASSATAITQEEGYFVYGFGAQLPVPGSSTVPTIAPWTQTASIFRRDQFSGTEQITGHALFPALTSNAPGVKIDAALPDSQNTHGSGGMATQVGSATDANATIGILGADFYDAHRDTMKSLAFRGHGQTVAYWADSTATSFDKRNVRDGRYLPIGPVHMVANIDAGGVPTSTLAKDFIGWVQGTIDLPGEPAGSTKLLDTQIASFIVPPCAMNVERTSEGGPFTPRTTGPSCACYFDAHVTNGSTTCATCTDEGGSCGTGGTCRYGYCDVR
jgi:ABC-type phosphate transport system substrate-binding protein